MRAVCINTIHSTWKNIVFTGFFIASTLSSIAAERVALVIGNGAYEHTPRLVNPVRDADAVEKLLGKAGFEIVLIKDADAEAVYAGLEKFKIASRGARIGLVYYAGHGVEVDGKNYLLPVDAELSTSSQLRTQAVALDTILSDMEDIRLPAKMVILDCCRDNPLASRSWLASRSSARGGLSELKDESVPSSTMIMFASAPGNVALDGVGENSPFTTALLHHLAKPEVSAFDAFLGVSDMVVKLTNERQIPWIKFDGAGRTFRLFSLNKGEAITVNSLKTMTDTKSDSPIITKDAGGKLSLLDGKGLGNWKPIEFGGEGEVNINDGVLSFDIGDIMTGVAWIGDPPSRSNYEILLEAKKIEGNDFFCALTFPVKENHATFIIGGWGGGVVGISNIDGLNASENDTMNIEDFESGLWYQVKVRVTDKRIEAWINDRQMVSLDLAGKKIDLLPGDFELCAPLGIASFMTQSEYRNVSWRNL